MALTDNLDCYWALEEASGTREDATAANLDLTPTNTPSNTTGKIGSAVDLVQSSTQYLSRADFRNWTTGSFSVSLWVKWTSLAGDIPLVYAGGWSLFLYKIAADRLIFRPKGRSDTEINPSGVSTGAYYHIVIYSDGSKTGIVLNNGTPVEVTQGAPTIDDNSDLRIGYDGTGTLDGAVDEMGVWSRALTSGEIGELYNGGAGLAYPFSVSSEPARKLRRGWFTRRV